GTLPATALFEEVLGVKTLFFSFSTADEKLHAPNEFMRIRRLREGMRAWEHLWRLLASGTHRLCPVIAAADRREDASPAAKPAAGRPGGRGRRCRAGIGAARPAQRGILRGG